MKRKFSLSLLVLLAVASLAMASEDGTQKTCPMSGGSIDKDIYTDYKDMRVFFCSDACKVPFNADPEKHLKAMAAKGEKPMKLAAQSVCPVSGMELMNKELFVEADGKKIYICCADCVSKVKEHPAKYAKVIAERGEFLESAK
jgi:YHS domain-containing protein